MKGYDPRSLTMTFSYSRREIVVAACSAGLVVLVQPAMAATMSFKVNLNGAQQVPPVQTGATGTADLTYDPGTRMLTWNVTYSGLSGPATMAHVHGPAAQGKNGPPVIWLSEKGAAVGNPIKGEATLTPEQAQQMMAGDWYINVHTQANPGGEIRGQVMPPKS
jgi:CHRD domain-containing protein